MATRQTAQATWPILVDDEVADVPTAVIGSGLRRSKVALPGEGKTAQVIERGDVLGLDVGEAFPVERNSLLDVRDQGA